MRTFPRDANARDYRTLFARLAGMDPKVGSHKLRGQLGEDYEHAPVHDMLTSSALVDYVRHRLPESVGTQWKGAPDWARGIALGGYKESDKAYIRQLAAKDPELALSLNLPGRVPAPDGHTVVDIGNNVRAAATQGAAAATADIATDGLRNIWWFLNAPQAISSIAMLHGMHAASNKVAGTHLLKNRNLRMAATMPAWIGTSLAIGNFTRQPGYKAAVPGDEDPREPADQLSEIASRYFLGRGGRLLKYEEFAKERPDVSKGEYNAYKAYLFGDPSPIKATMEGIHGPEVTFMGKSIPIITGLLPAVAAVAGGRYGMRRAGHKLRGLDLKTGKPVPGARDRLVQAKELSDQSKDIRNAYKQYQAKDLRGPVVRKGDVQKAVGSYRNRQRSNEMEAFKQTAGYSAAALTSTALIGQVLESMRRANKGITNEE